MTYEGIELTGGIKVMDRRIKIGYLIVERECGDIWERQCKQSVAVGAE